MTLRPLEELRIMDSDYITGPEPSAWVKVRELLEHVIKLERRIAALEERNSNETR